MLLEAAALQFAESGYARTSFADLIDRAGVSKGAFYFHFRSKDELALAAFRLKQEQMATRLEDVAGRHDSAIDRLFAVIRERSAVLVREPSFRCLSTLSAELAGHPQLGSRYREYLELPVRFFTDLLEQAQREGGVLADPRPDILAEVAFAGMVGIDYLSDAITDWSDLGERTERLLQVLHAAIAGPSEQCLFPHAQRGDTFIPGEHTATSPVTGNDHP
jgi:AcrR family transcriptional regulator